MRPQGSNMSDSDSPDIGDIGKFDPGLTERMISVMRPFLKTYFRSEVHGLDAFPPGGALVVGNHSGGMFPMDVPIFSVDFYDKFGYGRPVYTLSHDMLFMGLTAPFFRRPATSGPTTRTPPKHCGPAAWWSSFPAATTTHTGPRCRRTSSTSTAARDTSERRSKPVCRSCPRFPSAARRPSCTCPAAPGWPSGWG